MSNGIELKPKILLAACDSEISGFAGSRLSEFYDIVYLSSLDQTVMYLRKDARDLRGIICGFDIFSAENFAVPGWIRSTEFLEQLPLVCIGNKADKESSRKEEQLALENGAVLFFTLNSLKMNECEQLLSFLQNMLAFQDYSSVFNLKNENDAASTVSDTAGISLENSDEAFFTDRTKFFDDKGVLDSFLCSACILEVYGNKIFICRANEDFFKELLDFGKNAESLLNFDVLSVMSEKNAMIIWQAVKFARTNRRKFSAKILLNRIGGVESDFYIKFSLKMIENCGDENHFYCTIENYTPQYEIVKKEKFMHNQLQLIIQNIDCGVTAYSIDKNLNANLVYCNKKFLEMIGFSREQFDSELHERSVFELILPEYKDAVKSVYYEAAKSSNACIFECQMRRRDGSVFWLQCRTSVCFMAQESIYVTVYSDITQEKKSAEKASAIINRLRNSDIFIELNVTKQRVEIYHSVYEPELSAADFEGQAFHESPLLFSKIHETDREIIKCLITPKILLRSFYSGEEKSSFEYKRFLPDGSVHWFSSTMLFSEDAETGDVLAYMYSIDSDRKVKNRIAKEKIINTSIIDISVVNIKTRQVWDEKNIYSNENILYEEKCNHFLNKYIIEDEKEAYEKFFNFDNVLSLIEKQDSASFSFWCHYPSGENIRLRTEITYLDTSHEDLLFVVVDITNLFEREQAERMALINAAKLADFANQTKMNYFAQMCHDIRSPLSTIIGMTELAQKANSISEMADCLANIESSGKYLLSLINDSLDLSKIESGKMELNRELYRLEDFKNSVQRVIQPLMDEKNINFQMNLESLPAVLEVDSTRFNQIFFNLLSNACKYTARGGEVKFYCEFRLAVGKDPVIRFHVKDNGIGIRAEFQESIFKPFYEVNNRENNQNKGTGLGLVIVKNIVALMGGQIMVESSEGQGSNFIVDLPLSEIAGRKKPVAKKTVSLERLQGLKVLLAEDVGINALIMKSVLEFRGCIVTIAANGKEAVEAFSESKENEFDLIITDLKMPVMDGFEAARMIRAMERSDAKTIPIIASTADAFSDTKGKILEAGMNCRVVKPIDGDALGKVIVELLAKLEK